MDGQQSPSWILSVKSLFVKIIGMFERFKKITSILKRLPDRPGIYLFYSQNKELIYVGKATSLKSRVRSYFKSSEFTVQSSQRPIELMTHEVADIKWRITDSVLEAIILEAEYIKKFQPKYNVDGKDDKSWNYIVISKDAFPKVETMRQRELEGTSNKEQGIKRFKYVFGPYPGLNTKAAMKLLRRMFRFSNCVPANNANRNEDNANKKMKSCLYRQMGWCPGVCTGEISAIEYRRQVIRPLVTFLKGKKRQVIKMFAKEMKRAGKEERFEDAARLRDQLKSLQRIQDIALLNKNWFGTSEESGIKNQELRIEGYDISNLGASDKVGSMVVFNQDGPVKNQYRKFIIRTVAGQSDVDSLAEVLERRLKHPEWPFPNVFLIDGGRPQVNKVKQVFKSHQIAIPFVGIAKGPRRKNNNFILGNTSPKFITWVSQNKKLLIQVRDEAHRFAISFHRARHGHWLD